MGQSREKRDSLLEMFLLLRPAACVLGKRPDCAPRGQAGTRRPELRGWGGAGATLGTAGALPLPRCHMSRAHCSDCSLLTAQKNHTTWDLDPAFDPTAVGP